MKDKNRLYKLISECVNLWSFMISVFATECSFKKGYRVIEKFTDNLKKDIQYLISKFGDKEGKKGDEQNR